MGSATPFTTAAVPFVTIGFRNRYIISRVACKRMLPVAFDAAASSGGERAQSQAAAAAAVQAWLETESSAAWCQKTAETMQVDRTDLLTCLCAEAARPHPAAAPPLAAAAVADAAAAAAAAVGAACTAAVVSV